LQYEVLITPAALADAEEYVLFIRSDRSQPVAADAWWNGLLQAVFSLENMPQRCPIIPENGHFLEELRHLLYFFHRIVFSISGSQVTVLRIYHASRQSNPIKSQGNC
jgi:plasmid stabilization system protein ParE